MPTVTQAREPVTLPHPISSHLRCRYSLALCDLLAMLVQWLQEIEYERQLLLVQLLLF